MRKTILYVAAFALIYASSCNNNNTQETAKTATETEAEQFASVATQQEKIKRGQYLVTIAGCHDCHSPKIITEHGFELDTSRILSGYNSNVQFVAADSNITRTGQWVLFNSDLTASSGPWGTTFAANLTPDPTGLGGWTFENFKTALRKGKYKGLENSRPLLPPMPWQNLQHLTDEDMECMFDYLQSLKPVNNRVPAPLLAQR